MVQPNPDSTYDLRSVNLPHLTGLPLRLVAGLLEGPLRGLLQPRLLADGGITAWRARILTEAPTPRPLHYSGRSSAETAPVPAAEWPAAPAQPDPFASIHDYAAAYRAGTITPIEVAESLLEVIAASDLGPRPLRAFIAIDADEVRRQAAAAAARWQAGEPLSVWDGVPVAIKDEVDMVPYPTTVGTAFWGDRPAQQDATVVVRLRAAGALLLGKANMHEIGIGVTGNQPIHGTIRNPYNLDYYPGGSSSGSAAAVAAGFCPVAVGADGGGSVRIPAGLCGLVGLKPTYGRVSEHGAAPLCWSVAHLGPLAGTATDAALLYALMAGADPADPQTWHQPAPTLAGWDNTDLSGLTIGIYRPWFNHASADMVAAAAGMLAHFQSLGAAVRAVVIPDLELARVAHAITIAGEMAHALEPTYAEHHRQHGLDVRVNLALARTFTTRDFLRAQQARTRLMAHFDRALADVDVILTPATGIPAPPIAAAALSGESDLTTLTELMRFVTPANLTGLPAISFPGGYNEQGLPLPVQVMGRAWDEVTLLRLALAAESGVARRVPAGYARVLPAG